MNKKKGKVQKFSCLYYHGDLSGLEEYAMYEVCRQARVCKHAE